MTFRVPPDKLPPTLKGGFGGMNRMRLGEREGRSFIEHWHRLEREGKQIDAVFDWMVDLKTNKPALEVSISPHNAAKMGDLLPSRGGRTSSEVKLKSLLHRFEEAYRPVDPDRHKAQISIDSIDGDDDHEGGDDGGDDE